MNWRWDGKIWVPDGPIGDGGPPCTAGAFVGQIYDDRLSTFSGPPDVFTVMQHQQQSRSLSAQRIWNAIRPTPGTGLDSPLVKAFFLRNVVRFREQHSLLRKIYAKDGNPQRIFSLITGILSSALERVGVAHPVVFDLRPLLAEAGSFNCTTWTMQIDKTRLTAFLEATDQDTIDERLGELANTLYHESRHVEQFFRVLRFLVGTGMSRQEIRDLTEIPVLVIQSAQIHPLCLPEVGWSLEALEAMRWFQSVFGVNAIERRSTLNYQAQLQRERARLRLEYDSLKGLIMVLPGGPQRDEYRSAFQALGSFLNNELSLALDDAHEEYKKLAEEADAWSVGDDVPFQLRHSDVTKAVNHILQHFDVGRASGVGNNCLLDTLYQHAYGVDVADQDHVRNMREVLRQAGLVLGNETLDIYGQEGRQLLAALGIRIRVVQIIGGRAFLHPVVIGTGGPLFYVLHYGNHFVPLRLKGGGEFRAEDQFPTR